MNSRQRRQSMTRRHMEWPLGARVVVRGTVAGDIEGRITKHWREHPHTCSVEFPQPVLGLYCHRIPFGRMALIDKHLRGARPWYKRIDR